MAFTKEAIDAGSADFLAAFIFGLIAIFTEQPAFFYGTLGCVVDACWLDGQIMASILNSFK